MARFRVLSAVAGAVALATLGAPAAHALGQPYLVRDIDTKAAGTGADFLARMGGAVFFRGNDAVAGHELWKTDGTAGGTILVADINAGPSSSSPEKFAVVGGTLFFVADDGVHGPELWMTDGTAGGTVL